MDSAGAACYTAGSVAGAVFGTLLTVLVLLGLAYLFWRFYWRRIRGKHLYLETGEREAAPVQGTGPLRDRFAFDNPCFLYEDSSPNRKNKKGTPKIKADGTAAGKVEKNAKSEKGGGGGRLGKWTSWSPIGAFVGSGGSNSKHNEKRRAFDDSFVGEPERVSVSLRGHDFTGLGFNVCGNMRDGIFVRDVLHRGPASESGQIAAGDRIISLGISFEHMVFEDALTILSYASPYEVLLQVEKGASPPGSTLLVGTDLTSGQTSLKRTTASSTVPSALSSSQSPDKQRAIICHPFYRSQSIDDLDKIGKASINAKRAQQIAEMTRIKTSMQDEGGNIKSNPASEVDGHNHGKVTAVEDEKLQKKDAPVTLPMEADPRREAGEDTVGGHHTNFPKFGVRVLPPCTGNPNVEKVQNVGKSHNPGGNQNNPGAGSRQERSDEPGLVAATPEPQKQNERNSMIEMGVGKETENKDSHNPINVMKSEGSDNPSGTTDVDIHTGNVPSVKGTDTEEALNVENENSDMKSNEKERVEAKDEADFPDGEGMITDVPEEVCMAAMAAVTNRKLNTGHTLKGIEDIPPSESKWSGRTRTISVGSSSDSEDGERISITYSGNGGKRRAPAPPADQTEKEDSGVRAASPPCETEKEDHGEEKKKKGGTRIELGLDHITIHHQPTKSQLNVEAKNEVPEPSSAAEELPTGEPSITEQEESDMELEVAPEKSKRTVPGGKAASLGDLSCLEGGEVLRPPRMRTGPSSTTGIAEGGLVLERAVSLDLGNTEEVVVGPPSNAAVGSVKKRKAPAPPTPTSRGDFAGSDEIDSGIRLNRESDGGEYGKEPRLAGGGATDTFGRRLKKSSDWGTMAEALLAAGSPPSSSTSLATSAGRTILHLGSTPSFQIPPSTVSPSMCDPSPGIKDYSSMTTGDEVSTTRGEYEEQDDELPVMRKVKTPHLEISLQSSVITSSDADNEVNSTVTSTTETVKNAGETASSSVGIEPNRVVVTTSSNIEGIVDSTSFPPQQGNQATRGDMVHMEIIDDMPSGLAEGSIKPTSGGDICQSSFQRAREFFEREEENASANVTIDDDDDDATSSPPSLPTSPMPTMQSGSPLSLHSTTTYISSLEDMPLVHASLLDRDEFGASTHTVPGIKHHITEIQVRSLGEDGKTIETREVVVGQDKMPFGRIEDMNSGNLERNLDASGEIKFSVSPVKIPMNEGDIHKYASDSFPLSDNTRAIHQIGYKLTTQIPNISESNLQTSEISNKSIDSHSLESPAHRAAVLSSPVQYMEENGGRTEYKSSSEIVTEAGNPTVQIRMRDGPSGWIPYRQRNSQADDISDERKENSDSNSEGPKVAKKKPPVPPRKDTSNTLTSESPNKLESSVASSFSPNVTTILEVPVSFTNRLVQVHETREDEPSEGTGMRHGLPVHRVMEREVIQITPQELDKVMMSHSQFLSHKTSDSPLKTEQWVPGTSTRTVVHRIVEHWVTDEDGKSKIVTESSEENERSSAEVVTSESGIATPPNGIVSTVAESTVIESTPESRRQNMSITRIMVDPEFSTNTGRTSDSVAKTMMVANLQLSGTEGKSNPPTGGLHT